MSKQPLRRNLSISLYLVFMVSTVLIVGCSGSGSSTPPTIVSVNPEDRAVNVSIVTSVSVTFNQPMNTASAEGAFSINPNVPGTFSWDDGNTVMTFTPSDDLADGARQYTCTVGTAAKNIDGNALSSPHQWRWTTWSNEMTQLIRLITDSVYGFSITADPSGNVYLAVTFDGKVDFGAYFGTPEPKTSSGGFDIFVTKINADGTYAWTKPIGGAGFDSTDFITTDPSGNVYLVGTSDGTADFGAGFGTTDVKTSSGSSESASFDSGSSVRFLTKINADGTYVWTKQNYDPDKDNSLLGGSLLKGSTTRHIYNNSSYPIMLKANTGAGNVYFLGCPKGNVRNGPCTIPPKTALAWEFTRSGGQSIGMIQMSDVLEDRYTADSLYSLHYGAGPGFWKLNGGLIKVSTGFNDPAKLDMRFTDR
ncbi:MAG: Ig-like domain-containing protein [Deltaproteobacteria bacterium]|nr:Ig-like domain-containing protein [Deltaproteobacteria bacterium]